MASPLCEVKDGAGAYAPTTGGVNVTAGGIFVIRLGSDADVDSWSIACLTTDELGSASTINAGLVIDSVAKTATGTAPVVGRALRFQSQVNGGIDRNGVRQPSYTTTFCIYTLINGARVHALDETVEGNVLAGWGADVNALIRGLGGATRELSRVERVFEEYTTTNATQVAIITFPMVDETACAFDVIVTACRSPAATKGGRWKRSAVYRRTSGGSATIIGTIETGTDQETDAGFDVTFSVSSSSVRVMITGLASNTIHWTAELRVQETAAAA